MKKRYPTGMGYITVALILGMGLLIGGCAGAMTSLQRSFQAQRAYEAGLSQYKAKDFAAAAQEFRRAVELDPRLDDAEAHLAWSHYHAGEYAMATKHFRQTIARQPEWPGLYDGLGWSRYRLERYQLALEAFQKAVAMDPTYRDAGVGLAYSLFMLKRYREALPHLERLTREGEGNGLRSASTDLEEVRSRYAWTLYYLGDAAKAREQFAKGISAQPNWAGLHNGLGWTLLKLGDRQSAKQHFQHALNLQPELADAEEGLMQAEQAKL
ncbi:MAG TPA: tetratricopeptide repeat protein [Candidatus Methylomirabilis sp.]|nr:tetratricopeptide repeat protein [Candidatus Methylomirabilis sp.]